MPLNPAEPCYIVQPMPPQITNEQRQALLALDTATIGHHLDAGGMDPAIHTHKPGAKIAGTAVTVRCVMPDSVMAHYALKFVRPGDVLVIDRGQDGRTACWGAATAHAAAVAGLSGLIIDGATSDVAEANEVGLHVWSRGVSSITTKYRGLGGEMNVAVSCGGVAVSPGDAILADDNGVLVIPRARVAECIEAGRFWQASEREFRAGLDRGERPCYPDMTGASAIVERHLRRY